MKSRANAICQSCPAGTNALNGRYCQRLRLLVEYKPEPPCVETTPTNQQTATQS